MIHHIENTQAVRSYFGGNPARGRTTTLVVRNSGEKLIEVMGATTRQEAYRAYAEGLTKLAMDNGDTKRAFTICTQTKLGVAFFNMFLSQYTATQASAQCQHAGDFCPECV